MWLTWSRLRPLNVTEPSPCQQPGWGHRNRRFAQGLCPTGDLGVDTQVVVDGLACHRCTACSVPPKFAEHHGGAQEPLSRHLVTGQADHGAQETVSDHSLAI